MTCSIAIAGVLLAACTESVSSTSGITPPEDTSPTDDDGDGVSIEDGDCNDENAAIYPGAEEVCDALDNDCDEDVDEGVSEVWYDDTDADGFGDPSTESTGCAPPLGTSANNEDCDDADQTVYPDAPELCGDGKINNCAGSEVDAEAACFNQVPLESADSILTGQSEEDHAGQSVWGAGDVNGDGFNDLLIGAHLHDTGGNNSGAAYVVFGGTTESGSLDNAPLRILGDGWAAYAAYAASGAGDVDGDGFDDLLVGAYLDDSGSLEGGAAYLIYGGVTGDLDLASGHHPAFVGAADDDNAGYAVSSAGDSNNDGFADLLIGAHQADAGGFNAGSAYVIYGPATNGRTLASADGILTGEATYDYAASALDNAQDTDGDGFDDVIIGAYYEDSAGNSAGAAYLVRGPISGTISLHDADAKFTGEAAADFAGFAVSSAGDIDGDGLADLLVGAHKADNLSDNGGAAYVISGAQNGTHSLAESHGVLLGHSDRLCAGASLDSAGDLNGDDWDDVLIGAPEGCVSTDNDRGNSFLVLGPVSGTHSLADADARFLGEQAGDHAGHSLAGLGDTNNDGLDDVLIGAADADAGRGRAYLIYGAESGTGFWTRGSW